MSKLSITTANIRFDNPKDGPHDWAHRRAIMAQVLNSVDLAVLGTQEGREGQIRDLNSLLPKMVLIDAHRSWISERMYPSLFFDPLQMSIIDSGDIWLSETPDVPGSVSFGSTFPRLCTWAKMSFKANLRPIFIINVHLDHVDHQVRLKQAQVLTHELNKLDVEQYAMVLFGDFNEGPLHQVRQHILTELPRLTDPWGTYRGHEMSTHHPFNGDGTQGERIDWILVDRRVKTLGIEVHQEKINSTYPSDHFPIRIDLDF